MCYKNNTPDNLPLVSVIIPCRNEERFIGRCLDSVIGQDYPKKYLEVLVVDGISQDKTREILKNYTIKHPFIRALDNDKKNTPCALNRGIKNSKGEIIIRMDSHAVYQKEYISKCVKYTSEYSADNIGGTMITLAGNKTTVSKSISIAMSNWFGVGDSTFRIGSEKVKLTDTVFGGCYKKEVFEKIGLFNENLIRNQDLELNLRLRRSGGRILFVPDIVSYYYSKSNLMEFFIHNLKDGFWVIYPLRFGVKAFSWRHLAALTFVSVLIATGIGAIFLKAFTWFFLLIIGLYFSVCFYFSIRIAIKENESKYVFVMPITFFIRHFGYGLGSLYGLSKAVTFRKRFK